MRMLESQLASLTELLKELGVKYAILGGVAVSLYGEPRYTYDTDLYIILDKSRIEEFIKKARRYNFSLSGGISISEIMRTGVVTLVFSLKGKKRPCDIIFSENILEYNTVRRAKNKKIGAVNIRVATPEDLIIHKMTSIRPRDREDVRGILIRRQKRLDAKYIQNWLNKIDKANADSGSRLSEEFRALKRSLSKI